MTLNPLIEAPRSIWRGGEKQAALVRASASWWRTWRVSFSRAGGEGSRSTSSHAAGPFVGNANARAEEAGKTGKVWHTWLKLLLCVDGAVCYMSVYGMNLPDKVLVTPPCDTHRDGTNLLQSMSQYMF